MIISIAIAVQNKDGVRCKEGDIIAIRPAGWQWGTKEVKEYLIVEVDLGTTISTLKQAQMLQIPQYEDGSLIEPSIDIEPKPAIIGKRRFSLPFADLQTAATSLGTTVDWNRVKDLEDNYQPFIGKELTFLGLGYDKVKGAQLTKSDLTAIKNAI